MQLRQPSNLKNRTTDAVICTDSSGLITGCNQTALQFFGWQSVPLGKNFIEEIITQPYRLAFYELLSQYREEAADCLMNQVFCCEGISQQQMPFELECLIAPVCINNNSVFHIHFRDTGNYIKEVDIIAPAISDDERLSRLFQANPCPIWVYDRETLHFLAVNQAAVDCYGYSMEEYLTMKVTDICSEDAIPHFSDPDQENSFTHIKLNGHPMVVETFIVSIRYLGRPAIFTQIFDVTGRARLKEMLTQQRQIQEQLIHEAIDRAGERERSNIGKELHDNVNQILATVKLYMDVMIQDKEFNKELLKMSRDNLLSAIDEIRRLSRNITNPQEYEKSLSSSVDDLVNSIRAARKIEIDYSVDQLLEKELSVEHKINIYRIIQEQMHNILKYSGATQVAISIKKVSDDLELTIQDNGCGFDTTLPRKGMGITNIISRASLFNGDVNILSSEGQGCRVQVLFKKRSSRRSKPLSINPDDHQGRVK